MGQKSQKSESKRENLDCPCPETWCERHGKCTECQAYHHKLGQTTSCGK